ncbi:MAG: chemotaxis protein CheA, partial [Rhodocyclaceae bacterium]|nr:chemotaxis protein CheA [Rhodocyclaceae bacterium]
LPLPGEPAAPAAYGFFIDPAPDAAAAAAAEPAPAAHAAAPAAKLDAAPAADPGYGFFEPVAVLPAAVVQTADKPVTPAAGPGEPARKEAPAVSAREAKAAPKAAAGADNSIRVSVEKVDQMINLVGELVITQAMLAQSASKLDPALNERLMNGLAQLERNTRDLQESVMSIRMMPISVVFSRFPRVVRDLSQKLGKQVRLVTIGEGTELDKGLVERITDPLTHLVRNSLDHGIESPSERQAAGKPAEGTITLKAYQQSGNIVIEVGDDGAGLRREKILAKARERGMNVSDSMADHEVWGLIFEAGFSTADKVTEVSGRGVGMDVVKKNIAALGGRVDIE